MPRERLFANLFDEYNDKMVTLYRISASFAREKSIERALGGSSGGGPSSGR